MVDVLVRALESREGEPGSLGRLARASRALAEGLELSAAQREALELGALLHDIGEIRTPETVLRKPGPLTAAERLVIQAHPASGAEILEVVPLLTPALDVVGAHHEHYDGSGYPLGLKGPDIPVVARIFAVADALDAMTHDRPYRPASPAPGGADCAGEESGKQFDLAGRRLPWRSRSRVMGRTVGPGRARTVPCDGWIRTRVPPIGVRTQDRSQRTPRRTA
jgi:putative nucleotidyltransferase with HDIG domain